MSAAILTHRSPDPFVLAVLAALVVGTARAGGVAGDGADRLDAPGSATDRYLSTEEIRGGLHAANGTFFACFREHLPGGRDPGETAARFRIPRTGRPEGVEIDSQHGSEALKQCLVGAFTAIPFSDHDGAVIDVAYPLVWQVDTKGARVIPYPVVFTRSRPIRVPLLLLPPDVSDAEITRIEKALEAPPAPPSPAAPGP